MGICPELVNAIEELGFESPMPVQKETIPELLENKNDLVVLAQTGTGKTAAFGLPVLQQLNLSRKHTEVLILSPTRELCVQIANDLKNYAKYMPGVTIVSVYGGASIEKQKSELEKSAKIIVATPGRLLDLIRRKYIRLDKVTTLILDEADEMLDMGFKDDLDEILQETPAGKQTLLFSATMPEEVNAIARAYMKDPKEIAVGAKNSGADNVSHYYYLVNPKDRYDALKRVADYYPNIYAIIFCRTKVETQEVANSLIRDGYNADALHGDLSQSQRDHVMQRFRYKNLQMLVATDVAARGLDVHNLTHVINYNLPNEAEQYNHRSGRTGRANKKGISISIVGRKEIPKIQRIEQVIRKKIEWVKVPSGKEICEKQLFHMVDEMENVEVNYEEIEGYLPVIHKKLAWLDKEELIRRFVSVEFNRFLDYYRNNSRDINIEPESSGAKERKSGRSDTEMTRICFGIGYHDRIVPQRLIGMINDYTGKRHIRIGKIDIQKDESYVDVDTRYAQDVVNSFADATYRGMALPVKISKSRPKEKKYYRENEYESNSFSKKGRSSSRKFDRKRKETGRKKSKK